MYFHYQKKMKMYYHTLKILSLKQYVYRLYTLSELEYGAAKSVNYKKALEDYIYNFSILPFDNNSAQEYGKIRAELEKIGSPIGSMDMLTAAHAKSQNLY